MIQPVTPDGGALAPMPVGGPGAVEGPRIAIVDVDGLLLNQDMVGFSSHGENPVSLFREKLDRIASTNCYRAVVLRINSPGGGVTASDIMWRDLNDFKARTRLPVVASLMDVGTGGAYYVATSADQIMAHPTSITGGIGVILNLYNLTGALEQFNVVGVPIKSGELIDMGTPIAVQEEARPLLQKMADDFHKRFEALVQETRGRGQPLPPDVFDGRVFTATQALDARLIDSIGYLDDAIRLAGELAGCPGAVPYVLHRCSDRARTPYDATPNTPLQTTLLPLSIPGLERSRLPTFLYMWQPEPTLERLGGR